MNVIQKMGLHEAEFTPNDRVIYEKISGNLEAFVNMTTSVLAEKCGVSQPALTRFIKNLGYRRYAEFRADMISYLAEQRSAISDEDDHLEYFNMIRQLLNETEKTITDDFMTELVSYIGSFERVYMTGESKSFQPAELFETLMLDYKKVFHAVRQESLSGLVPALEEDDLLIVFAVNAPKQLLDIMSDSHGKIMLVTTNVSEEFNKKIDKRVVLPFIPPSAEESAVSPVLFDMFVEILAKYIKK